ncbi:MAG: hypothetical protein IH831_10895 [Planctomycetes bacterium]|nr:hypothetical protein [Planctomycetota bacterium]
MLISTACFACAQAVGFAQLTLQDANHAEDDSESIAGILVLRNGNVLEGKIQRLADFYRIEFPRSELLVRVGQVDMFCHHLDEAYERRRLQRTGSLADSHVELARWCLRHELLQYASRELLDARSIDPDHRQLLQLERQLQLALRNRAASRLVPEPGAATTPTDDDLELLESVPDWGHTLFVRQIQPLLVNSCATSGCHQPGSSESFHLNRLALEGAGHPATTLRNLAATLAQLDLESPAKSKLLERAKTAHGAKSLSQNQLGGIQRPEKSARPNSFGTYSKSTLPPQALEPHRFQMLLTWVEQLSLAKRNTAVKEIELVSHRTGGSVDALPLIRRALEESAARPTDPFDPEQFNSRQAAGDEASSR